VRTSSLDIVWVVCGCVACLLECCAEGWTGGGSVLYLLLKMVLMDKFALRRCVLV